VFLIIYTCRSGCFVVCHYTTLHYCLDVFRGENRLGDLTTAYSRPSSRISFCALMGLLGSSWGLRVWRCVVWAGETYSWA
jgi:hypothetical protein